MDIFIFARNVGIKHNARLRCASAVRALRLAVERADAHLAISASSRIASLNLLRSAWCTRARRRARHRARDAHRIFKRAARCARIEHRFGCISVDASSPRNNISIAFCARDINARIFCMLHMRAAPFCADCIIQTAALHFASRFAAGCAWHRGIGSTSGGSAWRRRARHLARATSDQTSFAHHRARRRASWTRARHRA